jgi:hypothetical protein
MSGTLSATTASALAPYLQGATGLLTAGSTAYNLYNQYQNQQYQDLLRSYAQDPAKMNAYAAQFTQPLNAGLTAAVNNQTQAQLAQSGLSESPQIAQTVEAQAIAPYIQQNQQQGYQDALQALGLGGGAIPPQLQGAGNLSAITKALSTLPNGAAQLQGLLAYVRNQYQNAPTPQTTSPDIDGSIPYQPTEGIDLSDFYQPVYSGGGGGGDTGGGGDYDWQD